MSTCGDCTSDRHDRCNGDTWDDDSNQPAVCDCWEHGHHGLLTTECPWCPERMHPADLAAHLEADHRYGPARTICEPNHGCATQQCQQQTAFERRIYGA